MTDLLHRILPTVQKPARYTGGEYNEIQKNPDEVRVNVAFCFPDTYEIGMSNVGMRILYGVMNEMEGVWCQRVFHPWGDMEAEMRRHGLPLWALESQRPVKEFDMIAFTIGYEMAYTSIVNMLDLAGVPIYAKDRHDLSQMVFAGGVCTFNPEPLAPFFDFFSLGEGEESTVEIVSLYDRAKAEGWSKDQFLLEVSKIEGVYVPSFYEHIYNEDGTLKEIIAREDIREDYLRLYVTDRYAGLELISQLRERFPNLLEVYGKGIEQEETLSSLSVAELQKLDETDIMEKFMAENFSYSPTESQRALFQEVLAWSREEGELG